MTAEPRKPFRGRTTKKAGAAETLEGGDPLNRVVTLSLSEIVRLVRSLRSRANDCRYMAQVAQVEQKKGICKDALKAASKLDERAAYLAQLIQ